MFLHLFKYRFKTFIKSKEEVFWVSLFPILLSTCFVIAFSSISDKAYTFHSIPVAIVYEQENKPFELTIDAITNNDSQGEAFLNITETDADTAAGLLTDKSVDAIITVDSSVHMTVSESGINQTALQSFLNQYLQKNAIIEELASTNPEALEDIISSLFESELSSFITEGKLTDADMDPMASYYFALIAMALLFGGFFGLQCARQMKANISPEGMRKSIAPVRRSTLILAEFLATYALHLITVTVLLLYMIFILRIKLSDQIGYIALTCAAGSLVGISSGMFIGSIPKISENIQNTIYIVYSLASSFLAGLMVWTIKVSIERTAPIINRLNPATLIADALYSLLIYNTHERFYRNIITLVVYAIVLCTASVLMTRRNNYANL